MEQIDKMRKTIISSFSGMNMDMDYNLCIPSVHVMYREEEAVIDIDGKIRHMSNAFPKEKADLIIRWISLHKDEIVQNHLRVNHSTEPLIMITPLDI